MTKQFYLIWQTKNLNKDWLTLTQDCKRLIIRDYKNQTAPDLEKQLIAREIKLFSLEEIRSNPSTRDFIIEMLGFDNDEMAKKYKQAIKSASVKKLKLRIKQPAPTPAPIDDWDSLPNQSSLLE